MKKVKIIMVMLTGVLFLMSSAGIIVFTSHCSCTGNKEITLYFTPETCADNIHKHHQHDQSGTEKETDLSGCHECNIHTHDCGCSSPEVKYFRLINQITNEEVKFVKTQPLHIPLFIYDGFQTELRIYDENSCEYIDPPPLIRSSTDLVIFLHQLKIAHIA